MQQSPSHMTQQPFMATVTQLQNSHSKGPGGSCEGKGPENYFRWKISFCALPALPCPSLRPWLPPFSRGYQPARRRERDARRCGVAASCPILSLPRAIRRAASPVRLRCCPAGGMQHPRSSVLYKFYFSFHVLIAKTPALPKEESEPFVLPAKQTLPRCVLKGSGFAPPPPGSSIILAPALLQHPSLLQRGCRAPASEPFSPPGFHLASRELRKWWLRGRRWFLLMACFISLTPPRRSFPHSPPATCRKAALGRSAPARGLWVAFP